MPKNWLTPRKFPLLLPRNFTSKPKIFLSAPLTPDVQVTSVNISLGNIFPLSRVKRHWAGHRLIQRRSENHSGVVTGIDAGKQFPLQIIRYCIGNGMPSILGIQTIFSSVLKQPWEHETVQSLATNEWLRDLPFSKCRSRGFFEFRYWKHWIFYVKETDLW